MHVINKDMPTGLDTQISVMPYEDAKSIYDSRKDGNIKFRTDFQRALDEDTVGEKVLAGIQNQAQSLEQIKEAPRLIWGEAQVAMSNLPQWMMGAGAIPQAELRKTGAMNIQTANRNIEAMQRRQQAEKIQLKDEKNFVTMATSVGAQYGISLTLGLIPYVGTGASLGYIVAQEASGTAIEGLEQYKREHHEDKELKGFVDEKVTKELLLNVGKTFSNAVGEYILGAPAQIKRASKMAELAKRGFKPQKFGALRYIGKNALIGAGQEFAEEGLIQGTSDTIFDYLLGRYKDKDEAVMAWKENLVDSLYAGMFGGAFGMAGAINARAKGIEATRNLLKDVVPAEDLNRVATVVFENELKEARDVATVGLEISSQLNTQKGEIYDAFRNAAFQAMKESGGYKGLTDESLWAHANEVSERLSQEAVSEAFKRKVPIQEVIDSNDIMYKDGELHLAKTNGESNLGKKINRVLKQKKTKRPMSLLSFLIQNGGVKDSGGELKAMDAHKQRVGLINNKYGMDIDHAREIAAEAGYFGGNPTDDIANTTVADFLDLIDKELRGQKVYTPEAQNQVMTKESAEEDTGEAENFYERKLEEYGVDYSDMTFEQKEQAYSELVDMENKENMPSDDELEKIFGTGESQVDMEGLDELSNLFQESMDLANEMAAIDANNDAYTGETININGVEKTVYNSNGERIAKSEAALRSFYKWFGDSKVVDEQGRPLVVYHGSHAKFDAFSKEFIGKGRGKLWGNGFYFTNSKARAEQLSKGFFGQGTNAYLYQVYLKMENPLVDGKMGAIGEEYDGRIQHGAGTTAQEHYYIVKEPNQIKSTSNRGTYSLTEDNIYYQDDGDVFYKNIKSVSDLKIDDFVAGLGKVEDITDNQIKIGNTWYAKMIIDRQAQYGAINVTTEKPKAKLVSKEINQKAKDYFGLTNDLNETGYILSNGELLDFSGKKDGASAGTRNYDHREISSAFEYSEVGMNEFINNGNIRYMPESNNLLMAQKPTPEQLSVIRKIVDSANGNIRIELMNDAYDWGNTNKTFSREYSKGTDFKNIQRDINSFFTSGKVSDISQFLQVQGLGKNAPVRRGSYDANSKVIKLFENANTSTLPHELAHYWLDNMWNYAKSGNANPQYVAQFNAVRSFLGVKGDQENLTRAQHEKFASAYEKYLYRGVFPTPMMGTVFANYERFIRDVYQSINDIKAQGKSKVRLTPEIIQFFDSMTSGELPTDMATAEMLNETRAEEVHQYDSKIVEEVKKEIQVPAEVPTQATTQEILPVGSSGEVAESRLAKRTTEAMGMESDLQYERANIEKERAKAAEMWKNDPQKAQETLQNATLGNDVLRNALYTEQQRIALENGDRDTFLKSLRKQSAEATRAGQELAALRGVVEDIKMPSYWIRMAEWEAQKQLAKNMATYFDKVMGNTPLLNFTQKFDADVKELYEKVRKAETNAEKSKIMKEGLDEMKKTYRGLNQQEVGELFQTDWTNEELAYDYVEKKARDAVGLNLTNEKANAIIQASRDLDKLSRNVDEFGLPTAQFFAKKSELEYLINSHTPSSKTKVLLSTLGRANMLTAPATSVLNVASNVQNYGTQTLVRRLNNTITGHTNDNLVDSNLRKQYRKRVWDTFWATGYDLSMMNSIADTRLYRGESAVNSAGDGVIRQAGQWAEKHIFGELISSPDMVFKSYLAFTDFAGNEATDIAYKEGLTGDKAKARANELFTDAVKIEPTTEIGKQIRAKAQADALVITFQQDTKLARALLDLRNLVNKATGDIGVGDLLSAFVKTPANVLALGYDATVGPFGHLVNTYGAIQDVRAGNLTSARVMATIRQTTTMAVMQAIVAAFALGFIDDDDYIPDYSQLSPSERLIVKERGASFGSIRIGDTYISTDFFGSFEVPLTAWLNARRQQGFADSASAYIGSVLRKGLDAPVIKDLLDQAKAAENVGSDSLSIWEHIYDTAGNLLISRLTPNVMNTLAKMTDDYERETNKSVLNKLIARVPVARKTLAPKISVSTGKPVETPSALMQLLFGSRAHKLVDSTVSNELYRLYQAGERATISDITRSGDLKLIDEKEKQSAKEWFAREYSKAAERAIKTSTYKRKSDEDKKDELNKIRRDLVKQLKEKYKKKISVAKQKK